jgi:hypothetical protein
MIELVLKTSFVPSTYIDDTFNQTFKKKIVQSVVYISCYVHLVKLTPSFLSLHIFEGMKTRDGLQGMLSQNHLLDC